MLVESYAVFENIVKDFKELKTRYSVENVDEKAEEYWNKLYDIGMRAIFLSENEYTTAMRYMTSAKNGINAGRLRTCFFAVEGLLRMTADFLIVKSAEYYLVDNELTDLKIQAAVA